MKATDVPSGYSYSITAAWFAAGAIVTAVFSGSLAALTSNVGFLEVLAIGMIVPSFTWVVQLIASFILLNAAARRLYHGDLGRVCLVGSVALIPAALVNLCLAHAPPWLSAANVLISVVCMAADLFRRSAAHGISSWWPASWCVTIAINMALFLWMSRNWWPSG